ncbi:MAG: hypothetical protein WCO60_08995 [Verrucomicrobiota bacterium]
MLNIKGAELVQAWVDSLLRSGKDAVFSNAHGAAYDYLVYRSDKLTVT